MADARATPRAAAIGDHLRNVHEQLRRDLATVRTQLEEDELVATLNATDPATLRQR
ncbi:hypothetical protein [Nocardia sp. CA-135398]|uniref:hypothetical protein n=1 Tax=Nocardia sp. CA-135398 TaxID=3239977 RepID=UPI003D956326